MPEPELLRCPFCGGPAGVKRPSVSENKIIFCPNRDCLIQPKTMPSGDIELLIKEWNTRYGRDMTQKTDGETPETVVQTLIDRVASGDHQNAATCNGSVKQIDSAFRAAGWKSVMIEKGQYWSNPPLLCFVRSQGNAGDPIIQWRVTSIADELQNSTP